MSSNVVIMNPARSQSGRSQSRTRAFDYEDSLQSAGNGKLILMPDDIRTVAVTVSFQSGATGYVEATTDILSKVTTEDTSVKWVSWDSGEVSETTQDVADPPTALRMVQVGAGEMKMTVRAQ